MPNFANHSIQFRCPINDLQAKLLLHNLIILFQQLCIQKYLIAVIVAYAEIPGGLFVCRHLSNKKHLVYTHTKQFWA